MEKIDRLGWAAGISIVSYGVRIGIRSNDTAVLDQIRERLPVGWKVASSPIVDNLYSIFAPRATSSRIRRFNFLYRGIDRLARTMDLDELLFEFETDLHSYVAVATKRRVVLQAGVVGWRGQAIVIPGKELTGKSSLVTAFLDAGATYYSDEFALLDSRGRVHPYPRGSYGRAALRDPHRGSSLEKIGARTGKKPLRVGLVLLSEYRPGSKWRPKSLSRGQAALAMFSNVASAHQPPEIVLPMLGQVVASAKVLKGVRGEADEMVRAVLKVD